MKRYILLGIGIGVILTSIIFSFIPQGKKVNIDDLVEVEVQKRLKKVEDLEKVETVFQEVVSPKEEESIKVEEKILEEYEKIGKDTNKNSIFYILIKNSKNKNSIISLNDKVEKIIETKIELIGKEAYLFSQFPYSLEKTKEISDIMLKKFKIKVEKLKSSQIDNLRENSTKQLSKKEVVTKKKYITKKGFRKSSVNGKVAINTSPVVNETKNNEVEKKVVEEKPKVEEKVEPVKEESKSAVVQ